MNRLRLMMFALVFSIVPAWQGCKNEPEEPDSNKTAGEEIEQGAEDTGEAVEEGAEDTGEAIDEGAEDTGEAIDEADGKKD